MTSKTRRITSSDTAEREHADIGSSSVGPIAACPGWTRDQRPKPKHPVTESGSRCHLALETGDYGVLANEIEVQLVKLCEEYLAVLGEPSWKARFVERRVYIDDERRCFGYFDLLGSAREDLYHAHLVDYKFGWHPVDDAEHNWQGKFLAKGCWDEWPGIEVLDIHFPMPRVGKVTRHRFIRSRDYDRISLELLAVVERKRLYESTRDPGMLQPSFSTCRYCGAKATCPALRGILATAVKRKDETLVVPEFTHAKHVDDPDTLSRLRDLAELAEDFADSVKYHVLQKRLDEGIEIPGWKLVERAGNRKVTDSLSTFRLAMQYGVTPEEFAICSKLSIGELEEMIKSKAPRGKKGRVLEQFQQKLIEAGALAEANPSLYLQRE